jgi:SAM-dependent methyltransferase
LPYIDFCKYSAIEQAQGTILHGSPLLVAKDDCCFLDGDLARLLLLHNFGGVWCDMDLVLLRDLAPLLSQEFMYKWGTERDQINGAIMRMFAGSKLACDCLNEITRGPAGKQSTDWGSTLYGRVRKYNTNWTVFPCAFFNTEWQLYQNMGESAHPFRASSGAVPDYDGAFAWHWHNKWDADIESGCKWERIEKRIDAMFERKFNEKEYRFDPKNAHLGGNIAGGDTASHVPEVWYYLLDELNFKSVLDVGCGEGQAVRWFRERGLWVQGFDGIQINIERCPEGCFLHDLTKQAIRRTVDFVWACEVVEHVHERYMDKLMDTLTSGRVVAITHAWPGQAGFHHVNCQLPEYWIARFEARGYKLNDTILIFNGAGFRQTYP